MSRLRSLAWWASAAGFLLLLTLVLVGGWLLRSWPSPSTTVSTQADAPQQVIVMRTPGGWLEVATLGVTERFTRRDHKQLWGVDLGETVSDVALRATYRYRLPLAARWPVRVDGQAVEVDAPALQPALPVAFDTASLRKHTRSGWARFNKHENLAALERGLSAALQTRAQSEAYRAWVTEPARRTVAEYTRTWLLRSGDWSHAQPPEVRVRFPDEAEARLPKP